MKEKPRQQAVESETAPKPSGHAPGWESLPKEVRAIAEQEIKDGTFKNKAEYVKAYNEAYNQ